MNIRKMAVALAAFMISSQAFTALAQDVRRQMKEAAALYEKGMYGQAKTIFDSIDDPQAIGWSVLCSTNLQEPGYESRFNDYVADYPYSGLLPKLYWQHALNLFDRGEYEDAGFYFSKLDIDRVPKAERAEYLYKMAYCDFGLADYETADQRFRVAEALPLNDYTAPSRYAIGYIAYEQQKFGEALQWFEKSVKDPRFEQVSNYYIMECRFMNKEYRYVTDHGTELYDQVPEERRPHLARIISESYLVLGDADKAKEYYDRISNVSGRTRGDYFYAGTLMYTVGEYASAIENYGRMTSRTDSIGQIANYNMGYSYIQTKNKVEALNAFKAASEVEHDPQLTEDAFYNYAKLAFDINNDNSAFNKYLAKYSDSVKGHMIYSYQAMAALYDHDYAGAVAAYDKIEELDDDMVGNYMKANYLRAEQLVGNGAWRNAVPHLKAASYYSDKRSFFNQLSRYWLAESYFRNDQYDLARSLFTELYNISALDGKDEGKMIPYDLAYCYFKEGNYESAARWFDEYLKNGSLTRRTDAQIRKADCLFALRKYSEAASAYEASMEGADDFYPPYQAGLAYGLAGDNARKIQTLSAVLGADPGVDYFNEACYELGRTYLATGKADEASRCFSTIIDNSSDKTFVARALLDQGLVQRNAKEYDKALASYKRVVSDMPSTEYANEALSAIELLYQTKQDPEAYVAYVESIGDSAVTVDIDREELLFNAAEQIYLTGNWQRALNSLENYVDKYPVGRHSAQVDFYMAESYRGLGRKEQAIDSYAKVINGRDDSFKESAALGAAVLSTEVENWSDALGYYQALSKLARFDQNRHAANLGMMESAYRAKEYVEAAGYADAVRDDSASNDDEILQAVYVKAKSKLAVSERDAAMTLFKSISSKTSTPQGAEAAYMLIQDSSDKGDFADVESKVFALADSGSNQNYWMAKSFILLGDSYVERGDFRQARATFESVRDGYTSKDDDVLDNVNVRLAKLKEMGK